MVPVQSQLGLKEFHSQGVQRNVTYQLQTREKYLLKDLYSANA